MLAYAYVQYFFLLRSIFFLLVSLIQWVQNYPLRMLLFFCFFFSNESHLIRWGSMFLIYLALFSMSRGVYTQISCVQWIFSLTFQNNLFISIWQCEGYVSTWILRWLDSMNLMLLIDCFSELHTVCRKCIYDKITEEELECCPICNIDLGCSPLEKLRLASSDWGLLKPFVLKHSASKIVVLFWTVAC